MTRLSIRWRLTLWYGMSLAVLLCGFCVLLMLLMRQQVFVKTDAGLGEEVKELSVEVGLAESRLAFAAAANARFTTHGFYDYVVVDEAGQTVFASAGRFDAESIPETASKSISTVTFATLTQRQSGPWRVASATASSPFGPVRLHVLRSLTPLYSDLQVLQWVMVGLLPIGFLLALAVGHFLGGRALAPVQQVVDVANSIDITCLDRRIEIVNPHDEIGRLSAALNLLISRLEHAVAEIHRFTADASHEIRTPLAVLRAEAEATLRSPRTTAEYVEALSVIVAESIRLGRLADQLLHLSRYDSGLAGCVREPVPLDALLADVVEQLRPLTIEQNVTLQLRENPSCEILGDDIRLSQVFFNVVENAIKYTPGGEVVVRLAVVESWAVVEVEDNGPGIPNTALPHVFDRFFRADPSRSQQGNVLGGAGLGLSIAEAVVKAHDGLISICSEVGSGTKVTVRLPRTIPTPTHASHSISSFNLS